jgi:uncharacterized protein YaiI (UPF0178 family)
MTTDRTLQIWVDADACPRDAKDILYRVADRRELLVTLVTNQPLRLPRSPFIALLQVPQGLDVADDEIVDQMAAGDVVVTADIPLAAAAVKREAIVISPRGELFSDTNIGERLAVRDLLADMRSSGVETGGPPPYTTQDRQAFANQLDRQLTRALRRRDRTGS